jgi:branched-chain amino acid transport system ATP-binding protein
MDLVFGISDTITVLHQGRVIADGPAEDVRADDEVMAVYLGAAQPKEAT